jgi:hypothetical protein
MVTVLSIAVIVLLGLRIATLVMDIAKRRSVSRRPGVFRCVVQVTKPGLDGARPIPRPRRRHAEWVHQVLVIYAGVGLRPVLTLPAAGVTGRAGRMAPAEAKGVGQESAGISVRLDDGRVVRVIAPASALALLVGPYAASALPPTVVGRSPAA